MSGDISYLYFQNFMCCINYNTNSMSRYAIKIVFLYMYDTKLSQQKYIIIFKYDENSVYIR